MDDDKRAKLLLRLANLDEVKLDRPLTASEKLEYFEAEMYLWPDNEMFRSENLAATRAQYLA